MTLHAPSHHLPTPHISAHGHRLLRDVALAIALAVAVVLVFGAALTLRPAIPQFSVIPSEASSIVQFRASERDSWAAGQSSEGASIVEFRAGERSGQ